MRITNSTNEQIQCFIDNETLNIESGQVIGIDAVEKMKISHKYASYSSLEAGNSKVLKLLSFFDDPFMLRKEYHLVIDFEITNARVCDSQQLIITAKSNYSNVETRTHYEYFIIECDGEQISPDRICVVGEKEIMTDFKENNRKLARWEAFYNIILEPLVFGGIGYLIIYLVFSIWFGTSALFIVLLLISLNILSEMINLFVKSKNNRWSQFLHHFSESVIYKTCYDYPTDK